MGTRCLSISVVRRSGGAAGSVLRRSGSFAGGVTGTWGFLVAKKGVLADLEAAQQQQLAGGVEQRRERGHVGADGDGPESDLVPRQQVTGEREEHGQEQEHHANDPVELTRWLVGAVIKDSHHVQEDEEHHQVRRPSVDVARQ